MLIIQPVMVVAGVALRFWVCGVVSPHLMILYEGIVMVVK